MLAKLRALSVQLAILPVVAFSIACEGSSPTSPSAASGGSPVFPSALISDAAAADGSTLKVAAPLLQSPVNNAEVDTLMPLLSASNAVSPFISGIPFVHEFQVYRVDANGGLTMVDSGSVPQGAVTTSYAVQTPLDNETSHQWKARGVYEGAHGPWSELADFRTNVPVHILEPTLLQPASGEVVDSVRPVLEVGNPQIVGDPGTVFIEFQIASDPNFLNIVAVMSEETGNHAGIDTPLSGPRQSVLSREEKTSAQPDVDLDLDTSYHWRARGINGPVGAFPSAEAPGTVIGEFSESSFFTIAPDARTTFGGGGVSGGTAEDQLDLSQVVWLHTNVSSWDQTSTVTSTVVGAPPICINHSKAGGWPASGDFTPSGAVVEANAWVFANIGGTWYAATWEWFRPGQTCKSLDGSDFRSHVNGSAPLTSWTPKSGETVGLMVSTPARLGPAGPARERSNVVLVTWP